MQLPARGGGGADRLGLAHRHATSSRAPRSTAPCATRSATAGRSTRSTRNCSSSLAPDLIVTQDLCEVCAVSSGEVKRVSRIDVETVSLDPRDLEEIEESIRTLARHLHAAAQGERLAQAMHHRIDFVHQLVRGLPRQRVFVAEWLDPPFAAGHWVPEMVDLAGGDEVLGRPRERSFATTWDDVREAAPQLIVLAPCGFDLERTVSEAGSVPAMGARVVAVDGDAAYSRPGPRVAEGVAQLAHLLHPDDVEAPALPWRELS